MQNIICILKSFTKTERGQVLRHIKLIFLYCCLFSTNLFADTLDTFIRSFNEQEIIASWVADNSLTNLTQQQAKSIVGHTYAHSISNDINPKTFIALIKVESGFNRLAKSNHNAKGLAQVIEKYHKEKIKKRDLFNTVVSVEVGTLVLKECIQKHKGNVNKGLSCYNGAKNSIYYSKVKKQEYDLVTFIKNNMSSTVAQNN